MKDYTKRSEAVKLAEVFYKHNFFSEETNSTYPVLLDIYSALSEETKETLREHYAVLKERSERKR